MFSITTSLLRISALLLITLPAVSSLAADELDAKRESVMRFNTLLATAQYTLQHQNFSIAERTLDEMVAQWPENSRVYSLLGLLYCFTERYDKAIRSYTKCTALNPKNSDANFNLAVLYATSKPPQKEAARASYKRALEFGNERDTNIERLIK